MYNFNKIIDRRNTSCTKYDGMMRYFKRDDLYPLWVADMDFSTPPFILKDIRKKAKESIFGYGELNDKLYGAIKYWQKKQYNWKIKKSSIVITTSVLASISTAIEAFSDIDDEVIVFSPVWNPFYDIVKQNGRIVKKVNLLKIKKEYKIDFKTLKNSISKKTKILLLCSPHNPIGKVWTKKELLKLGNICIENHIKIVSDEIHSDLSFKTFTPMANISQNIADITITLNSPTKSFNLSGLNISYMICSNKNMYQKFKEIATKRVITSVNIFATIALISAYTKGDKWLKSLNQYIYKNIKYTKKYLNKNIKDITFNRVDATYLIWLDLQKSNLTHSQIDTILKDDLKLALMDGKIFDNEMGDKFFRMNIAIPRKILKSVLKTIFRYNGKILNKEKIIKG